MKITAVSIFLVLFLSACGGTSATTPTNPNTPPEAGTFKKFGTVALIESSVIGLETPVTRVASGAFNELVEAVPFSSVPSSATDTCIITVVIQGQPTPPPTTPAPPTDPIKSLDAGDPLTLSSGSTVYATLPRQIDPQTQTIFYSSNTAGSTSLPDFPASATVDIPGATDGFPAFSAVALPSIPSAFELTVSGADLAAITKDTTFSWTGQGSSTGSFTFYGSQFVDSQKSVSFFCNAVDDGSFSFPDKTKGELDAAGFTTGSLSGALRQSFRTETKGDALLYLYILRSQTFIPAFE